MDEGGKLSEPGEVVEQIEVEDHLRPVGELYRQQAVFFAIADGRDVGYQQLAHLRLAPACKRIGDAAASTVITPPALASKRA